MLFRVWRKTVNGKYNGFEELNGTTPQEAIKAVQDFDWETGDVTSYTYEVEPID